MIGKYFFERLAKIGSVCEDGSEFSYRSPVILKNDLGIAVSQSGETADTLKALKKLKNCGANCLGVVNVVSSAIARESGEGVYLHAGPEIAVASTKAFTCQVIALVLLGVFAGKKRGTISSNESKEILTMLSEIPKKIKLCLKIEEEIKRIARKYFKCSSFLFLGRDINFPVAMEGALKLKELSYIHAEGYSAGEMKHGPIALIDKETPTLIIANNTSHVYGKILSNIEEIKARGGSVIAVATKGDDKISSLVDDVIFVPKTLDVLSPLMNVIPLQLFSYHCAVLKGLNVDKPRNLAKSVSVE